MVFVSGSLLASLQYEKLFQHQQSLLKEQLEQLPEEQRPAINLPEISLSTRLNHIGVFMVYSGLCLSLAFILSHLAVRKINRSLTSFNKHLSQIKSSQDLHNFNPHNLDFLFNELNQAFDNISEMARQLGRVLNDKNLLVIKSNLLSNLVIKNTKLTNWKHYVQSTFGGIYTILPFDFICVYLHEPDLTKIDFFWGGPTNLLAKRQAENLIQQQLDASTSLNTARPKILVRHFELGGYLAKDFTAQPQLLVQHLKSTPQVGNVQGVFLHSKSMQDLALRLSMDSLLVVLLNLLGASRAISGYTKQLELSIHRQELENAMAADVLYGHLLVKNTDQVTGISQQICSSSQFSGDVIQVKRSPSGRILVLLADATGQGLSATITIMPVIAVFNAMVQKDSPLSEILQEMNKNLVRDLPDDRFVAALLVELDPSTNLIRLWNGGMPAALLLNNTGQLIAKFKSQHMALGILEQDKFNPGCQEIELHTNNRLFMYSDGLIEQENPTAEAFGIHRLIDYLAQTEADLPIQVLINHLLSYAQVEQPDDDVSICHLNLANLK